MDKVNAILQHKKFRKYVKQLAKDEKDRVYCRHDLAHFLDVARICYIMHLELGGSSDDKELIYAAGLLHDIGKHYQYKDKKVCHAQKSAELAVEICRDVGFSDSDIAKITAAIAAHRKGGVGYLQQLIYKADKASRLCMNCAAEKKCNWNKKNAVITH